jgi:hypothetical protein
MSGHLLAAIARGDVDVTRGLTQGVGDVAQDEITLLVPVEIVDRLEVVDVEHDQADRVRIAPDLVHHRAEELLKVAVGGQAGEVVADRLAPDVEVEVDVGQRQRGPGGERAQQLCRPR